MRAQHLVVRAARLDGASLADDIAKVVKG